MCDVPNLRRDVRLDAWPSRQTVGASVRGAGRPDLRSETVDLSATPAPESVPLSPLPVDLTGKTAVVTGATAGIGREVAAGLAGLGAHVIMVARSAQRAEQSRAELIAAGASSDRLEPAAADLSRPGEVASLARGIAIAHPRIDILVNNAACYPAERLITADGFEESWATNVLAYEVFTTTLQPALAEGRGRVVYVSSSMAGGLDTHDLLWERRRWSGLKAYKLSKQANRMLAWAWQGRLAAAGVAINVAHPDGTATNIAGRQRGLWGAIARLAFRTQRPPAEGADTPLWLAASPDTAGHIGGFYVHRSPLDCAYQRDPAANEALWALTQRHIKPFL
jgi:NAD(P)-dependent dehydrogenase (short-subunit alcohol dehydrogenase family)